MVIPSTAELESLRQQAAETSAVASAMELWLQLKYPSKFEPTRSADDLALHALNLEYGFIPGKKSRKEKESPREMIRRAADSGSAIATEHLGNVAVMNPRSEEAFKDVRAYAEKAATKGRTECLAAIITSEEIKLHGAILTEELRAKLADLSRINPETTHAVVGIMQMGGDRVDLQPWFDFAFEQGSVRLYHEYGCFLLGRGRTEDAVAAWEKGAAKGNTRCAVSLINATALLPGAYLSITPRRLDLARASIADGNPDGMICLAEALAERGKKDDFPEASKAIGAYYASDYRQRLRLTGGLFKERFDGASIAATIYPEHDGHIPLLDVWSWLWDKLSTDPRTETLASYRSLWEDFAFDPDSRKEVWLDLSGGTGDDLLSQILGL